MRVRLRTTMAGPDGCHHAGDVIELDAERATELLQKRVAEPVIDCPDEILSYKPWPDDGCTLYDALKRTADPDLWKAAIDAEGKLAALGGRRGRRLISIADPFNENGDASYYIQRERDRRNLKQAAATAWSKLGSDYYEHMVGGRLIATGANGRPSELPSLIRPLAWREMKVSHWKRSIAIERTANKDAWYGIRVFPVLAAPNAVELVMGLPFREAFRKFVLEDSELRALARLAIRIDPHSKPMLEEGKFGRDASFDNQWPTAVEQFGDFSKVIDEGQSFYSSHGSVGKDCQIACAVLRHRYVALLELCRKVGMRATVVSTGTVMEIDPVQLSRPSAWIDVRNGDLMEESSDGKLVARWTGMSFVSDCQPAPLSTPQTHAMFHMKPPVSAGVRPTATEQLQPETKALKQARTTVAAVTACKSWLIEEMQKSPSVRVGKKQDWWQKAKEKWLDTLSRRKFDLVWEQAVMAANASAWSFAGAPRKPR